MGVDLKWIAACFLLAACRPEPVPVASKANPRVNLIMPVNRLVTTNHNQVFSWNAVPSTVNYDLVIATANADSLDHLVTDTLTQSTNMSFQLHPGRYAWYVNAISSNATVILSDTNILTVH